MTTEFLQTLAPRDQALFAGLQDEDADAPGRPGAMTENTGSIRGKSNAAGRDAAAAECSRICEMGHQAGLKRSAASPALDQNEVAVGNDSRQELRQLLHTRRRASLLIACVRVQGPGTEPGGYLGQGEPGLEPSAAKEQGRERGLVRCTDLEVFAASRKDGDLESLLVDEGLDSIGDHRC